jgi:uncharacterized protein (TIRG00374 family)
MKKKIIALLKYLIFVGLGIFLVWWQFHHMTSDQKTKFFSALQQVDFLIVIPIILMSLASHLSRALRWRILMEPMGYKPSILNTFGVTMVGYLVNTFVPRLGEIIKCTLLGKYENIPSQKLIGTIVVERLFDFFCYLVFIVITVLLQYKLVGNFVSKELHEMVQNQSGLPFWGKMLIYLAILIVLFLFFRWLFKKYKYSPLVQRIHHFLHGLQEGIASIWKLKRKGWFLFHTLFIWSMYLLQIYIGFMAIKEISHLGINAAFSVLTLATLAMIVTPGGLGTFPTAVFLVLKLYEVEESFGEAFGWLVWGTNTVIVLVTGIFFAILLMYKNKHKMRKNNSVTD